MNGSFDFHLQIQSDFRLYQMAGAEMTRTNFTQLRLRLSALVAGDRATAGKVAALRRVCLLYTSDAADE